jgi:hypothetical protein
MRRLYPALAWPDLASAADPVGALVVANLDRRPIYLTELDNADRLLAQFQVESVGNLHRLKARP